MINLLGNLNINNNNYSTLTGESAVISGSEQAINNAKILESLKLIMPGQTLEGQLVSQDGKALSLLLNNNTLLNTTLDSQANLSVGQNISFEVKSNNNGHLVLRPLHTNVSNEATAIRALESASVKVSEETIKMVDSLMKEGMPINKETLQSMNRDMNMYPSADIKDIVMLHKMDMPVNNTNIEQMHLYNNNNQWMMDKVENTAQDIIDVLNNSTKADYNALLDKLIESFDSAKDIQDGLAQNLGKTIISEDNVGDNPNSPELTLANDKQNLAETISNTKDIFNLLKQLSPEKLNDKDTVELIKNKITESLSDKFLMEPDKVADKEYVKNYYDRVVNIAKNLEEFMAQNSKSDTNLAKDMSGIKDNINFMNQMNELYNYVQLPLKMAGAQAQGDLYVYAKKKNTNQNSEDEPLTALLHLSMEYLGNLDVFLKLNQGKLTTDFSLEKEEMIDFIAGHIDELNSRLTDKGYNVTTTVGKMSDENKNVIDEIRSESPQVTLLSSQTFDARA